MKGMPTPRERPGREEEPRDVREISPEDLAMLLGRGVSADAPQQSRRSVPPEDGWSPPMDVFAEGDSLVVTVDLPGARKRDVQVKLDRGVLVIEGEISPGSGDIARLYYRTERPGGRFRRLLQLPFDVRAEEIKAHLDHGLLTVRLPGVAARAEPQRIPVH
jgi:HSP20 family molecular chaperone IbpA